MIKPAKASKLLKERRLLLMLLSSPRIIKSRVRKWGGWGNYHQKTDQVCVFKVNNRLVGVNTTALAQ